MSLEIVDITPTTNDAIAEAIERREKQIEEYQTIQKFLERDSSHLYEYGKQVRLRYQEMIDDLKYDIKLLQSVLRK